MFEPSIKLTKDQLQFLIGFKHVFTHVQDLTGVPWQLLAGIWTRESFSVASPRTPGGPMQFDPLLSQSEIVSLLARFAKLKMTDITWYAKKGVDDFDTAVLCTACFLLEKMGRPIMSNDDIMVAAWKYNGVVGKDPTQSPYVYNGYDAGHNGMHLVGTIPDGKGGRKNINIIDHRPGAFTVYTQLVTLNA
jgi:hypothetical protein